MRMHLCHTKPASMSQQSFLQPGTAFGGNINCQYTRIMFQLNRYQYYQWLPTHFTVWKMSKIPHQQISPQKIHSKSKAVVWGDMGWRRLCTLLTTLFLSKTVCSTTAWSSFMTKFLWDDEDNNNTRDCWTKPLHYVHAVYRLRKQTNTYFDAHQTPLVASEHRRYWKIPQNPSPISSDDF